MFDHIYRLYQDFNHEAEAVTESRPSIRTDGLKRASASKSTSLINFCKATCSITPRESKDETLNALLASEELLLLLKAMSQRHHESAQRGTNMADVAVNGHHKPTLRNFGNNRFVANVKGPCV